MDSCLRGRSANRTGRGCVPRDCPKVREQILSRQREPEKWAEAEFELGAALFASGKRESGSEKLAEAVAAYREVLKEFPREWFPKEWVMTSGKSWRRTPNTRAA